MGHLAPKQKSEFHKMAVQTAMERALVLAQSHTQWLQPQSGDELGKVAWADCQTLYENTILQLNRTLSKTDCTEFDQQTWLSTALTNLETCNAGFIELGWSESMLPFMSNNVSKLISNSLALQSTNYSATTQTQTYEEGFPSWVSRHDRKLLQSKSGGDSANLVVAQDGSGNYKTITEAISAASKRSGSGRFVIHVKSGVYKENVVIGNKIDNIMLVGDGMGKTIITGSKSVVGGATTFNSATFGKAKMSLIFTII